MSLFSDSELSEIMNHINGKKGNFLITFRNKHGPTRLKRLWTEMLGEMGHKVSCLSWWSGASTIGLLECETEDGLNIYGQWVLDDEHKLLSVMEIEDKDLATIRNGFDAQTVTDSAMRAIRIGESGGEME
ncbi:MAG: hypothetical protein DRO87_04210 [Candidatus Thorarchaeota archaeon]|nr:MAG: hypothetical protein DRP09_00850 [Candidatus Thorarchaeota archaeon]RLI59018.1 MAG: hypothetical protein DRO87_04210 [Candidatus Thorarchaeota archaeon]